MSLPRKRAYFYPRRGSLSPFGTFSKPESDLLPFADFQVKGAARRRSLSWRCGVLPCWTVSLAQAVDLAPSESNVGNLVLLLDG